MEIGVAFLGDLDAVSMLDWALELDADEHVSRLWVADERFLRDPWVQLGALAALTRRTQIGICVTDPFVRHPALTASAAATLDELSGERAVLGLGAGSTGFAALGIVPHGQADAVRECIELCRLLWAGGDPISYEGREVTFRQDRLHYRVRRQLPIYVAARGPRMMKAAAQHADAVLVGNFIQGHGLEYALTAIAEGERQRSGPSPLRRAAWVYFSVGEPEAARAAAARGLALMLWSSHSLLTRIGYELPPNLVSFLAVRQHSLRDDEIDELVTLLPDGLIDDCTIAGDVPTCVRKLRALRTRGFEEVAILPFAQPGVDEREIVGRLLADVVPQVSGAPAQGQAAAPDA